MKICPNCGGVVHDNAPVCPSCNYPFVANNANNNVGGDQQNAGYQQQNNPQYQNNGYNQGYGYNGQYQQPYGNGGYPPNMNWNVDNNNPFDEGPEGKSRGVAALFAIIFGYIGVQYFYLGKIGAGLLSILLTFVTCGAWSIVTLIQGILMFCMSNEEFRRKFVLSSSFFPVF